MFLKDKRDTVIGNIIKYYFLNKIKIKEQILGKKNKVQFIYYVQCVKKKVAVCNIKLI